MTTWYNVVNSLTNVPATFSAFGYVAHNYKGVASMGILSRKQSGVYAIVNKTNGKRYIGSSVDIAGRWRSHVYELRHNKHHSPHLQNAWNKYGESAFDFIVLEIAPIDKIVAVEQKYLDQLFPEYNTNRVANSLLGFRFSDEAKKAMAVIHTGFRHTEESKKRMSEIWSGRPRGKYTEERASKISASHKGKKINDNQKRGLAIGRQSPKSAETRKKISDAQKGYKPTESTLEKLRLAWIRRKAKKEVND